MNSTSFLRVGSVVKWIDEYLVEAGPRGRIAPGTYFKVLRYDERDFYIQRCNKKGEIHKNSYVRSFGKYWLLGLPLPDGSSLYSSSGPRIRAI